LRLVTPERRLVAKARRRGRTVEVAQRRIGVSFFREQRASRMPRPWPDPLAALITRFPGESRVMAACGVVFGCLALGASSYDIARIPWELDEHSPTTLSSSARCGTFEGARYTIEVHGRSYVCLGAENKCPRSERTLVAYDARDPARCRVSESLKRPTFSELTSLLVGLAWLGFTGAVWSRRESALTRTQAAKPSLTYRISRAVCVSGVVLGLVAWLVQITRYGSP
jgi:hypothetical protein